MTVMSPLETLVLRESAYNTAAFSQGASVVREALSTHEQGILLAPLRGAMPILWAAEGMASIEAPPTQLSKVEIPLGTYSYERSDGRVGSTSARRDWKTAIIGDCIQRTLEETGQSPENSTLTIVDEVQKGGTLPFAVSSAWRIIEKGGFPTRLHVIAAQDVRKKVVAEAKTSAYRQLSSNSVTGTPTTVVPMPLIASDKANLLDSIHLSGLDQLTTDIIERFTVTRNTKAEELFRALGTMARSDEVAHDQTFLSELVESQGLQTLRAANRIELWLGYVVNMLAPQ